MKVTILMQDFFGQGAQYAMAAVARGMVQKGIEVDLLVSQVHKDLLDSGADGRIAFSLPSEAKLIYLPSRKARENVWAVRRYLKTTDSYAVMSTSGPYHQCLRYAAIGLRKHPLLVNVDHGNWGCDAKGQSWKPSLPNWHWRRMMSRWYFAGFDRKFFVNEFSRIEFLKRCPWFAAEKAITVYNPVIDDVFWRKVSKPASHPWLRDKKSPTFIAAGAYQPYKDHMTLLRAFGEVSRHVEARLVIFGKGPLEADYRKYIAEHHLENHVDIGGYTNNLPAEMKAADGFILSSYWESFGIVIAEALACGLPVISTDAPFGPAEILENGKYGKLIPVGDAQKMAEAILEALEKPKVAPPEESWNRFTLEKVTDRYLKGLGLL